MPKFSDQSKKQLATCDARIQKICNEAIKHIDFVVVEGHRGKEAQDKAFAKGLSKVRYPYGNHNKNPSKAVDIAPWPIDWSDKRTAIERFVFLQGVIFAIAKQFNIKIRQGLDWNSNQDMRDENFRDYPHFEVVD